MDAYVWPAYDGTIVWHFSQAWLLGTQRALLPGTEAMQTLRQSLEATPGELKLTGFGDVVGGSGNEPEGPGEPTGVAGGGEDPPRPRSRPSQHYPVPSALALLACVTVRVVRKASRPTARHPHASVGVHVIKPAHTPQSHIRPHDPRTRIPTPDRAQPQRTAAGRSMYFSATCSDRRTTQAAVRLNSPHAPLLCCCCR